MIEQITNEKRNMTVYDVRFNSINEFTKFINETPLNEAFRWGNLASIEGREAFTKTKSFDQASELLKNGWEDMSNKITNKIKAKENDFNICNKKVQRAGVAGYQPIVARYLAGDPQSMITTKVIPMKQKVINIVKNISYSAAISTYTIEEESIKALQIIKRLESKGYRCNLDICNCATAGNSKIMVRIRIKNANEKLNISKLVFPLVHPSMLRRLLFRFMETYKNVSSSYVSGYGYPIDYEYIKKKYTDSFVIPSTINCKAEDIKSLEDLKSKLHY